MDIDVINNWDRLHKLVLNRVKVVNHLLDNGSGDTPLVVRFECGRYRAYLMGCEVARWMVYDEDTTERALTRIDAVSDSLWYLGRSGRLSYV